MNLLAPAGLAFALLALPILALYMLKLRRREVPVSSALLWMQLLRDRRANAPWQKLRRQLLLFLQLLILAALTLALARPAQPIPSLASGAALIVLDASASMNAVDVKPSRFAAAREAALNIIGGLPENSAVTLILAGVQPRLLAANETGRAALRRALVAASPDQGQADWPAAFALAAAAAAAAPSKDAPTIVVISDGGISTAGKDQPGKDLPGKSLPGLPGEVRYLPIGQSADNLSISALAARSGPQEAKVQVFASVHNAGDQPREVILSFYRGDDLIDARTLQIAPGDDQAVVLEPSAPTQQEAAPGLTKTTRYSARLSSPPGGPSPLDLFALDDSATTIYQPPAGGRVLLATRGNQFLRQLLESLPGIQATVVVPGTDGQISLPPSGYDVYILDGILPAELPPGQLLLINPPENQLFPSAAPVKVSGSVRVASHALTRYLSWENVHILRARAVTLPGWATALVSAGDLPLVFAGEVEDRGASSLSGGTVSLPRSLHRRVAVITFDLHDSDLPLQVAFPVLFSNLLDYLSPASRLAPGEAAGSFAGGAESSGRGTAGSRSIPSNELSLQPGGSLLIRPGADVREILVQDPSGAAIHLQPEEGQALFNQTGRLGLYTVSYPGRAGLGPDSFAVNLFSPLESDIRPRASLTLGPASVAASAKTALGQRELWAWATALALIVLLLEWWVYQRQQRGEGVIPKIGGMKDGGDLTPRPPSLKRKGEKEKNLHMPVLFSRHPFPLGKGPGVRSSKP